MWNLLDTGGKGAAAPCSRGKHSATLLDGCVYVLGGRGAGGSVPLRDFWRYCLATGEWERLECRGEPPPALQEHSATAHESRLYVFGGEPGTLSNETPLWIYDTETGVWRKLSGQSSSYSAGARRRRAGGAQAGAPRGRRGHSAHALKDCLLVYGGYKDLRGSTNELWAFHYESESWQQVRAGAGGAGPARHRHAAALHDNRLYVHGGQCDLRACADLWHYDTMSREWRAVRARGPAPGARAGHAGLRAGAHFYIFGGEAAGQPTNELWRFHFATETWERVVQSDMQWPSARVDARALLVPAAGGWGGGGGGGGARGGGGIPPAGGRRDAPGLMREISRLSGLHLRRAARCSYSVLAADQDSTESLVRTDAAIAKSRSAYAIENGQMELSREGVSVPDFQAALPTARAALTPAEAARRRCLDRDHDHDRDHDRYHDHDRDHDRYHAPRHHDGDVTIVAHPTTTTVRFTKVSHEDTELELSTSDYASAERVNRLSGASLGFSNPHYGGPDVRALAALTPDSGLGAHDIEMQDLASKPAAAPAPAPAPAHACLLVLVLGGREPAHPALLHKPLSMWAYRLL